MSPRFISSVFPRRTFLALMGCFILLRANAINYFVATNGSDANSGTNLTAPFQTIEKASVAMIPGDTCFIRAGVYYETLLPYTSGTRTGPITYAAYSNEVVTLDAATPVTGWTLVTNGIYQAIANWNLGFGDNQLFVDGAMIHEAQIPAFGNGNVMQPGVTTVSINPNTPNVITGSAWGAKPDNYWVGAWFVGGVGYSWSWQTAQVIASTNTSVTVDPTTETPSWWFTGNGGGFLFGLSNMLGADNEWHLQTNATGNILYLRITGGADPTTHLVERKQRTWCVNYNNHNNIIVRGLKLWAGAVNVMGNSNLLENCQAQFLSHYMIITEGFLENGGVQQGGGIVINGNDNIVRGCTVFNTAGSGIYTAGVSNVITRNTIYNTDYSGTYASSINLHGNVDIVTFNTAYASGRDILRPEGIGAEIEFNDLSHPGLLCKDLGVIYCWGINGQGVNGQPTRIAYNWIHDNNPPSPAPLIYLDNWDANYEMDHNVIWNDGGDAGVRINTPAEGMKVYNNTLFNCGAVAANTADSWPNSNPNPSYWTNDIDQYWSSNNLYFASSPSELVNWQYLNFNLVSNAPAIDAGVVIPGITDGYVGKAPDLGAYEYGSLSWTAGTGSKPTLAVGSNANGSVKVTASPDAVYYQLYSATNLTPPVLWTPVTNAPTTSGIQWSMTLSNSAAASLFYSLRGL